MKITAFLVTHKNEKRIGLKFAYNKQTITILKNKTNAKWSKTMQCWHIADTVENRKLFNIAVEDNLQPKNETHKILPSSTTTNTTTPKKQASIQYKNNTIQPINAAILPQVRQHLILKGYSISTQKTYLNEISIFLHQIGNRDASKLTTANIKAYIQHCIEKFKLSENTIHSRLNALKFYYEKVLQNESIFYSIPRPKKHLQLPKILGETELRRLFAAATNTKHKAILFIAYSAGLRVSEVINLRIQDIDREREQLFIHCSKGKKDRYVRLSPLVLDVLEQYYRMSKIKPTNYLFEGLEKGKPYTIRSAQQIFSDCKRKAGIIKTVSFHSLRHSFATHIVEKGIDISYVQEILGHFDIRTTRRYLHVRRDFLINIESPIDSLYK